MFEAPSQTGVSDGRDEPSAPADDRGHDDPQSVADDATILHACGVAVQPVFRALARSARTGGRTRLPGPPGVERRGLGIAQSGGVRAALLLRGDARPGDDPRADRLRPRAAQAADGAQRRRGRAVSGIGLEPEGARGADDGLRRWPAGCGSGGAEGPRHRQRPHGAAHRARQGRQGTLRGALGSAARHSAELLAADASALVSVPGPDPGQADRADRAARGLPFGGRRGGGRQAGQRARAAAQLRNPPSGKRSRHPHHPGAAWARESVDDGALHARLHPESSPGPRAPSTGSRCR